LKEVYKVIQTATAERSVGPSLEWKCKKEKKYAFEILSRWTKLDKINCFPCHLTSKLLGPRM
jgi:hypothetical protein